MTDDGPKQSEQVPAAGVEADTAPPEGPPGPGYWKASDGNWYPPQQQTTAPPPPGQPPSHAVGNGMGVAALVLGIIGVLFGFIPLTFFLAWILGALALIFGIIGRRRAKRLSIKKGSSTAGVILGAIAVILGIIGIVIISSAVNDVNNKIGPASASDSKITQDSCTVDQFGFGVATGTITNVSGHQHSFSISAEFLGPDGTQLGRGSDYKSLENNQRAAFRAVDTVPSGTTSVTCKITAT
jgi:hypothetical protein